MKNCNFNKSIFYKVSICYILIVNFYNNKKSYKNGHEWKFFVMFIVFICIHSRAIENYFIRKTNIWEELCICIEYLHRYIIR